MSVLVKKMSMPDNCLECPLSDHEYDLECGVGCRRASRVKRPDDCPLVEVENGTLKEVLEE